MAGTVLPSRKRGKTTALRDYGPVLTKPRDPQARVLSPTRRHNPQPLGLVYQSPLHSNAKPYAIWNPDFRHTRSRFPALVQHLDLTNFSCGLTTEVSPWEAGRRSPLTIKYSLQSNSRFSYRNPTLSSARDKRSRTTRYAYRPDDGPALGIVPNGLPRISEGKSLLSTKQGSAGKLKQCWPNAALREIWRATGRHPVPGLLNN